MLRKVYCIRHGLALHNVLAKIHGPKIYREYRDTPLVDEGFTQAQKLNKTWDLVNDIDLVLVSPLTRTLQTASTIFDTDNVKTIAHDSLLEYPFGGEEQCNLRKYRSTLENNYPSIDFSNISEVPEWSDTTCTVNDMAIRKKKFIDFLYTFDPDLKIAVVSHSTYLQYIMYETLDTTIELKHCHPYELLL